VNPIHLIAGLAAVLSVFPTASWAQSGAGRIEVASKGPPTLDLKVCNRSGRDANVAVSYVPAGEETFLNRGWFRVANGACRDLVTTDNSRFYFYADAADGSERNWQGSHTLCVEYPGPYTFYATGSSLCAPHQDVRSFVAFRAEEPGSWTWTLDP
jgi:uncharacterized membrane protein